MRQCCRQDPACHMTRSSRTQKNTKTQRWDADTGQTRLISLPFPEDDQNRRQKTGKTNLSTPPPFSHLFCLEMAVLKYSKTFLRRSLALSFSSISLKTLVTAGRTDGGGRRRGGAATPQDSRKPRSPEKRLEIQSRRRRQQLVDLWSTPGTVRRTETTPQKPPQGGQNGTRRRFANSATRRRPHQRRYHSISPGTCDGGTMRESAYSWQKITPSLKITRVIPLMPLPQHARKSGTKQLDNISQRLLEPRGRCTRHARHLGGAGSAAEDSGRLRNKKSSWPAIAQKLRAPAEEVTLHLLQRILKHAAYRSLRWSRW